MVKNIVLSGVENSSKRALLTIETENLSSSGKLRLYNFSTEPQGIISLGIYQNGKVFKAGLTKSSQMLYTFFVPMEGLSEDFSCAVVNFVEGEPKPILYGNSNGYIDSEKVFDLVLDSLKETKNMEEVENVLNVFGVDYSEELQKEIDTEIDKNFENNEIDKNFENFQSEKNFDCEKDCENCKYRQFYYEKSNILNVENSVEKSFYLEMKEQIDKLFSQNKQEEYLEKLIANSKWVKVEVDDDGDYYVLGLIYDEEELKYICYGVPGVYQKNPPRQLSGYPIWFPLDTEKPEGFGYWLSYQDAETGESVKAIVV
jgi:hypothetical protein